MRFRDSFYRCCKARARRVVATDLDPRALRATAANATRNGVAERIEIRAGSWYEALGDGGDAASGRERFDVISQRHLRPLARTHLVRVTEDRTGRSISS